MTIRILITVALLIIASAVPAAAQTPSVTNVQVEQRTGSYLVDITYDLACATTDSLYVRVYFSADGGTTWPILCRTVAGDVGFHVRTGTGRTIVWDAEADYPEFIGETCRVRVVADDILPPPQISHIWRTSLDGLQKVNFAQSDTLNFAENDTIAVGEGFRVFWLGCAPVIESMSPEMIAEIDTIYPTEDGLLGYQYQLPDDDLWRPVFFNQATGDSISYFAAVSSFTIHNDGSGSGPDRALLSSGLHRFGLNTIDVLESQIPADLRDHWFVVNFDPQTVVLDGETDWAHPEDAEIYPYYILLNDPLQEHHPFTGGERIPDRSYVVFKALMKDDPRDMILNPSFDCGLTGNATAEMQLSNGGLYSFQTPASDVAAAPTWPAGIDGWSADTLGFLVAPSTRFTMNLRAVDEHGRRDGTPAELEFDVGYPPCVQCLEIRPKGEASAFDETLACYEPGAGAHPCFGDTATYYVRPVAGTDQPGRTYLERLPEIAFLAIDKNDHFTEFVTDTTHLTYTHYLIQTYVYAVDILMHGRDDAREAYTQPGQETWRTLAWKSQVDYECDPYNRIDDGGIVDDIDQATWGIGSSGNLAIDADGVWTNTVRIYPPRELLDQGELIFRYILAINFFSDAGAPDPYDPRVDELFEIATRQFGLGRVQGIALDQTSCLAAPLRPASYHVFDALRPPAETPFPFLTWRDCGMSTVFFSRPLYYVAMSSLDDEPASNYFRIVLQAGAGDGVDLECVGAGF